MKVIFLGTGEAFDENYLNNSSLVVAGKTNLLLDCGMTTPYQLWKYDDNQNLLDAVYISHSHADHYFGLPALLTRMWEEKRKKPFAIVCRRKEDIKKVAEAGYKGIFKKLGFKVSFVGIEKDSIVRFKGLELSFAKASHSIENYAVRIESRGGSVCYSGDGMFNEETERLYENCDLLIHETYLYDKKLIGHASVASVVDMAERDNIKVLALTHINRNLRKKGFSLTKSKVKIAVPKPFDTLTIRR